MSKLKNHDYVQILDIRGGDCRKTGDGAAGKTWRETQALFNYARQFSVPDKRASFLVDLHDPKGDLVDTVMVDARGYKALTNKPRVPTRAETRRYDTEHWAASPKRVSVPK